MAAHLIESVPATISFTFPTPGVMARRMLAMAALWLLFGVIAGCVLMPESVISLLSGAIAGALVLPWLGLVLGIIGGTVKESFMGALAGTSVAMLNGLLRDSKIDAYHLDICLIIGGMMGANFALFLAVRAWSRQRRLAARHKGHFASFPA